MSANAKIQNWELNQYGVLIEKILSKGQKRSSRAGDTYSIFGETIEIDMSNGYFPLLQGRKMFYKPVLGELAAFLRGPKHIDDFKKYGCNYWDSWGAEEGSCLFDGEEAKGGEIEVDYGNTWIDFNGVNQIEQLIDKLKNNPTDRRMLITGWRPDRLDELSLPCCHMLYQWYVRDDEYLDMVWYQRSVDTMVGLPSDIILCAAWNAILAMQCGYKPGTIKLVFGDTHIYGNHISGAIDYVRQLNAVKDLPKATYNLDNSVTCVNFKPDMFDIVGYKHKDPIKFELNV